MKLLKDQRIDCEDGEVKFTMRPVTTSQQARLGDLNCESGIVARVELAKYCLKSCIEKLRIKDIEYDPVSLADKANISDEETMSVLVKIGVMVTVAAFADGEDIKK